MANRPIFIIGKPVNQVNVEFKFFSGFSLKQKQLSVKSLHEAYLNNHPDSKILEVSRASENKLGQALSAFNLSAEGKSGRKYSVEMMFQASKVFENGGPYTDILYKTSKEAKQDYRLKNSGALVKFRFKGKDFPLEPKTFFYNWLYINTLHMHPELEKELLEYDAFTDISFNPKKSINCQAEACAVYVYLAKHGMLEEALCSEDNFKRLVYENSQLTLW